MQIDVDQKLILEPADLAGACIAVLGVRGSGKSNTAAVLIEELAPVMPLTVVDIEGEYWGLKERHDFLIAGRSEHVDVEIAPDQAGAVAEFALTNGTSVILDLSDFSKPEMETFLLAYFTSLWKTASDVRKPHQIVLEEAHEFVLQGQRTPLKELLTRIALRGRKRGLGIIAVSQRSAKVEKDVLTQASLLFLHRVIHPTDMTIYRDLIPLPGRDVDNLVRALRPGQAIVLRDNEPQTVQIRQRHTFHGGATPGLDGAAVPELRKVDSQLLAELQKLLASPAPNGKDDEAENTRLRAALEKMTDERNAALLRVQQLEKQLREQDRQTQVSPQAVQPPVSRKSDNGAALVAAAVAPTIQAREKLALNRQRRRFESLLADVRAQSRMHREILVFLTERDETSIAMSDIARRLAFSLTTVMSNPPADLVRLGLLIVVSGKGKARTFRSVVRKRLAADFPDLDTEVLVSELLSKMRV